MSKPRHVAPWNYCERCFCPREEGRPCRGCAVIDGGRKAAATIEHVDWTAAQERYARAVIGLLTACFLGLVVVTFAMLLSLAH